jgi:hypothetical protein
LPLSLTPARRRGFEYLDEPTTSDATVSRSLRDVALANRLFGGARALLHELAPTFRSLAARGTRCSTSAPVAATCHRWRAPPRPAWASS